MKNYFIYFISLFLLITASVKESHAHRVIFFAWVENGQIYTEGGFPGDKKAKNCPVIVRDEQKRIVYEGKTDEQGSHSFKIPDNTDSDLILTLKAGEGHQAEWRIPKAELLSGHSQSPDTEKLKSGPSFFKIISGIALIFILAGSLKLLLRKKKV